REPAGEGVTMVRKLLVFAFAASTLALFTQCSSGGSGSGGNGGGSHSGGGSGTGGSNGGGSSTGGSSTGGSSTGGSHTGGSSASGTCVNLGAKFCVVTCATPGLTPTDCPAGDVCAATGSGTNICIPNCNTSMGECGTGEGCSATNGFCTAVGDAGFGEACDPM